MFHLCVDEKRGKSVGYSPVLLNISHDFINFKRPMYGTRFPESNDALEVTIRNGSEINPKVTKVVTFGTLR